MVHSTSFLTLYKRGSHEPYGSLNQKPIWIGFHLNSAICIFFKSPPSLLQVQIKQEKNGVGQQLILELRRCFDQGRHLHPSPGTRLSHPLQFIKRLLHQDEILQHQDGPLREHAPDPLRPLRLACWRRTLAFVGEFFKVPHQRYPQS